MKPTASLLTLFIAVLVLGACNDTQMSAGSDAEAAFESVVQMFVERAEVREQVLEECGQSPNEMMAIDCEAAAEARRRAFRGDGQAYEPAEEAPELFPDLDAQMPAWLQDEPSPSNEIDPAVEQE